MRAWKFGVPQLSIKAALQRFTANNFVETLSQPPRSAFIADGSPITVQKRQILL